MMLFPSKQDTSQKIRKAILASIASLILISCINGKIYSASIANILNKKTNRLTGINIILESAENENASPNWQVDNGYSSFFTKSTDAKSGKHSIKWNQILDNPLNHILIYDLSKKEINLTNYKQLTCYLKSKKNRDINFKLKLKESSGEIWQQISSTKLIDKFGLVGIPLSEKYMQLNPESLIENSELDLENISEIQLYFWSDQNVDTATIYLDDLIIYGNDKYVFDPPAAENKNYISSVKQNKIGNVVLLSTDATSPNITNVQIDGKEIINGDYVESRPVISAEISDSGSGVATWDIKIINANSDATVKTQTGNGNSVTDNNVEISFSVSSDLADGEYYVQIVAKDTIGNTQISNTQKFVIQNIFKISDVLNGPNPFNPNQESTKIQYQLTKNADVKIYIYSISGEKLWTASFNEGDPIGGSAGFNCVEWNGINDFGEVVANGPYITYIIAKHGSETKVGKNKILVLK